MTHRRLFHERRLTKRLSELVAQEVRVIAETIRPARLADYRADDFPTANDFALLIHERRNAHISCGSIGGTGELRQEMAVVLIVERLASELRPIAPSLASDPRPSIQRRHLDPGIIGDDGKATERRKIVSFGESILFKGFKYFQRILGWRLGDGRLAQIDDAHAANSEQRTED